MPLPSLSTGAPAPIVPNTDRHLDNTPTSTMSQNMPFDTYFKDYSPPATASHGDNRDKDAGGFALAGTPPSSSFEGGVAGMDPSTSFSSGGIQFQMPSFLLPPASSSTLASGIFSPSLFGGGSPSHFDDSIWSQSSLLDKSKAYASSDKTINSGSGYTLETPSATSSTRAGKQSSLPFDFEDSPPEQQEPREDEYIPSPTAELSNGITSQSPLDAAYPLLDAFGSVRTPGSEHLPVYSQSGFDMLSILARIATRPNPVVTLGPVDMSCAFVVADVRQEDSPIIYASRSFLELTGYAEGDVIGKNCRFLQAPNGNVRKGEHRKSTSSDAVSELKWSTEANRECQVSLINYRKDGKPFVNRITIIPVPPVPGIDEIAYHVGFQVDLNESPSIIVQRIRDGKYYSDTGRTAALPSPADSCSRAMSKELRGIIFQSSLPLTTTVNAVQEKPSPRDAQQWLDLLLLEQSADFVHALSLKGQFLYVSPSTRDALGYEPQDLLGKAMPDLCHPSDVVPLLRELKESTSPTPTGLPPQKSTARPSLTRNASEFEDQEQPEAQPARTVDLLFRMLTKSKGYVWVEYIGQLHSDAGKNRKAIILSGRVCRMPSLQWDAVSRAGGLSMPIVQDAMVSSPFSLPSPTAPTSQNTEQEFWSVLSPRGIFLAVSTGVRSLLGWGPGEVIGRSLKDFITEEHSLENSGGTAQFHKIRERLWAFHTASDSSQSRNVLCDLKTREGHVIPMCAVLFGPWTSEAGDGTSTMSRIVVQFKVRRQEQTRQAQLTVRNLARNIFEELETSRSSTWQYEVQQQKIANRRLFEDVREIEAELV